MLNKKTAIFLSSLFMCFAVMSCSSAVIPGSSLLKRDAKLVSQNPSHFYIDAGNGQKTGASFSVRLNFANGGNFKIKANANGTPTAIFSDMTHLRVALIANATSPTDLTNAVTVGGSTTNLLAKTVASSGGIANVTFTNVPGAATTGTRYWVAAAAYTSGTNITNVTGATLTDATYGKFYVTTAGGGTTAGSVLVTQTLTGGVYSYAVDATATLTMTLQLRSGIGATIDATTTITNGNSSIPATTLQ